MNERAAAIKANQLYAYWDTLTWDQKTEMAPKFMVALDRLVAFMSGAQLGKYNDFSYAVHRNFIKI